MNITTEFPDFDNLDAFNTLAKILAPLGFVDTSWHNDASPSLSLPNDEGEAIFRVMVDYADTPKREFENTHTFIMIRDEAETITHTDDLERFIGDIKIALVRTLAEEYAETLSDQLDPPERDAVRENRAVPCDFIDGNEAMLLAWENTFDRSPFNAEGHLPEIALNIINATAPIAHRKV